jgi:hypothetical protein
MAPKVFIRMLLKVVKGSGKAHSDAGVAIQIVRPGTKPKGSVFVKKHGSTPRM